MISLDGAWDIARVMISPLIPSSANPGITINFQAREQDKVALNEQTQSTSRFLMTAVNQSKYKQARTHD